MHVITVDAIETLLAEAADHPRKRAILRLHEHEEPVQRMVNALWPGSYIAPHKHEDPDKVELFAILRGHVAVLRFTPLGDVDLIVHLEDTGLNRIVDIPPRTYHTLVALEPSALVEVIEGPYDSSTHKRFAPWAPREDHPRAADYYLYLLSIIHNRAATP